jgi:hypothetical protein
MVWHAWIITQGSRRTACIVRNVSNGGALLELDVPAWLPHEFTLYLEDRNVSALCDVRHRGRYGVGIAFRDAADGVVFARLAGLRAATFRTSASAAASAPAKPAGFPRARLTREMLRRQLLQSGD